MCRQRAVLTSVLVVLVFLVSTTGARHAPPNEVVAIGITPEAIAATGAQPSMAAILTNLESSAPLRSTLQAAREEAMHTNQLLADLSTALAKQPEDDRLLLRRREALHRAATAQRAMTSAEDALFEAAVRALPASQVDRLRACRESMGRNIPPEFCTVRRTHQQWDALEAAISAERRAKYLNQPLDVAHQRVLDDARSQIEVIEAALLLELHLDDVERILGSYSFRDPA